MGRSCRRYYIEVDSNAQNIIFNGLKGESRHQTNTLELGGDIYYAVLGWSSEPVVENIVVLDLTNADWTADGAKSMLYYWNDGGDGWLTFEAVGGDGIQTKYMAVSVSGLQISGFKLVRKSPDATETGWENVWNQTNDLTIEGGLYITIPGDNWNWGMQDSL